MSVRGVRRRFRYKNKFCLTESVVGLIEACRANGFSCYVCFGKDRVPAVSISKKAEQK